MDIYLTDLDTGEELRFPMLPEKIRVAVGNEFGSYQILGSGEVKIPSGVALDRISWSGIFPGWIRKNAPYIKEWIPIRDAIKWLEHAKRKVGHSKKLRLLVTETPVNIDVYLDSFSGEYQGGHGDYVYDLSLVQAKDLYVKSSPVLVDSSTTVETTVTVERPEPPVETTYTVVRGDCLWSIAQRYYGSGARYDEIYFANQSTIDSKNAIYGNTKYTIYPGQIFTIP